MEAMGGEGGGVPESRIAAYDWPVRLKSKRRNLYNVAKEFFTGKPPPIVYPNPGKCRVSSTDQEARWKDWDTGYARQYKWIADDEDAPMPAAMQKLWLESEKNWNLKLGGRM
ncbi:hypothetical protein HYALB_00000520 [Hymenoscyphus albidus]|uniref:Uncharacterized protein n=1 Tax=Hymenoscyphus albidus TaxID=595503 RepID=A0A9N9Q2F1_9HELO|nr:hypothetical protein HYALB_00000520 [Hymenoscyphus albidus]